MSNDAKCPHCGDVRPDADYEWLRYHEDDCHIEKLQSELDDAREAQRGNYAAAERLRAERDEALLKLGEAQDARETIELELLEKIDGLQSRLDAGIAMAEQLVDSEHGDAAGVALRILEVLQPSAVETQKRESGPASGYPEDFDNKWD